MVWVLPGGRLLQILLEDGRVAGGLAHVKSAGWVRISAPSVVLATGGAGRLFGYTTNPPGSRGVGYALGLEAGASLVDMEFIAFEPFVMAAPASMRGRSLPTTVLTEGARLRNGRGDEFLDTQSAPSKDVICRAMVAEVGAGRGTPSGAVYYDIREVAPEIVARYVQIPRILRALKMASSRALLEVMPAPHYSVGGVRIDEHASTEVPGLYAAGEVAGGAHGAHRLAACSATEVVAMGAIAGEASAAYALANPLRRAARNVDSQLEQLSLSIDPGDREQLARMQAALASGCGVLRDHQGLSETVAALDAVHDELITYRTAQSRVARANLVALAIAHCALARHESRGDHFRVDYARRNDVDFLGNFAVRHSALDDHLQVSWERAGLARRADAPLDGAVPRASP